MPEYLLPDREINRRHRLLGGFGLILVDFFKTKAGEAVPLGDNLVVSIDRAAKASRYLLADFSDDEAIFSRFRQRTGGGLDMINTVGEYLCPAVMSASEFTVRETMMTEFSLPMLRGTRWTSAL